MNLKMKIMPHYMFLIGTFQHSVISDTNMTAMHTYETGATITPFKVDF